MTGPDRFGILIINRDKEVITVNGQMACWFPDIDVSTRPRCDRLCGKGSEGAPCGECPAEKAFQDGTVHEALVRREIGGIARTFRVIASPMMDREGKLHAVVGLLLDTTASEQTCCCGTDVDRDSLCAVSIAHDYRNVLAVLKGNISLMKAGFGETDARAELVEEMELAVQRCLRLTDRLEKSSLGMSREAGPVDLSVSIRRCVEATVRHKAYTVLYDLHEGLPAVVADPAQIEQVIVNLMTNAMQAMPGGGQIKVSAEDLLMSGENALSLPRGRYLEITIEDHGEGIEEKYLPYIFFPYFTTREAGTGLGLTLCRMIAKNHGGDVIIRSRAGEGTVASMILPVAQESPRRDERHSAGPAVS